MTGIFGAGAATALQKANIYPRVDSVYGISSGAHNAAYFLSKDTLKGSSIYHEDLIDGKFIKKKKLSTLVKNVPMKLFNKNHKLEKIMDIDYLIKTEKTKNLRRPRDTFLVHR